MDISLRHLRRKFLRKRDVWRLIWAIELLFILVKYDKPTTLLDLL